MNYRVGDFLRMTLWTGGTRLVRVDWKYDNIKKGKPGFDGTECDMDFTPDPLRPVWGYDSQIVGRFPASHARNNKR